MPPLRGYQQEAVDAIVGGLARGGRGLVVAACGSGKTLVAAHAATRLVPAGLVVLTCPSLALVAQVLQVWSGSAVASDVLAVCSDDTVADAASHVSDLDCPVTTDPAAVADWIRRAGTSGLRLMLVTHQSVDVAGRGLVAARVVADLLVVDEAHRTAGRADKRAGLVHDDGSLPTRRRLYLTATPKLLAAGRSGRSASEVCSMDDVATFGPRLYEYPFARAIAEGWLDDYRVAVVGVTRTDVLALLRSVDDNTVDDSDTPVYTTVVQAALARAAAEFNLRRVVVFCAWVKESVQFARTLDRTVARVPPRDRPKGRLTCVHVDGTQSVAERSIALALLADPPRNGWTVLSNARCLGEGVDVPAVDGVVFTRPKTSEIDIVQAVGRALRRNPAGSGIATILVPVLLPDDPAHLPDSLDEWDTLCRVLRALRAHDLALAAELDRRRAQLNADPGTATLPRRVVMRLPDEYQVADLVEHITVRVLEQSSGEWWVGFGVLQAFHMANGHLKVPYGHVRDGMRLDEWMHARRREYTAGTLSPDRIEALNALGFEWTPRKASDERGRAAAAAYYQAHGHLRVPQRHEAAGIYLWGWLETQRRRHAAGTLDADLERELTAIGMDWQPATSRPGWDAGLAAARRHHATHGHLRVPAGTVIDGVDLNRWLVHQRSHRKNENLSSGRQRALDELDMVWDVHELTWQRNLAAAAAYATREGHLRPPRGHRENGIDFYKWINSQRALHRDGALPADRVAALTKIGMDWTVDRGHRR